MSRLASERWAGPGGVVEDVIVELAELLQDGADRLSSTDPVAARYLRASGEPGGQGRRGSPGLDAATRRETTCRARRDARSGRSARRRLIGPRLARRFRCRRRLSPVTQISDAEVVRAGRVGGD